MASHLAREGRVDGVGSARALLGDLALGTRCERGQSEDHVVGWLPDLPPGQAGMESLGRGIGKRLGWLQPWNWEGNWEEFDWIWEGGQEKRGGGWRGGDS
jgi:hypothetical protein